jgi:aryl-alcohol dehydrogenase-like predicted oxidoreductase
MNVLGRTGLQVSELGLGTMTWGRDTDEYEAREQFDLFLEAGGNLIDTADIYSEGAAESLIGELISPLKRSDYVIATKSGVGQSSRRHNSSRGHLLSSLDGSLNRLGVDSVDIWLVHVYDPQTPLEEVAATLLHALDRGKAHHVGVSNYSAWQLTRLFSLMEGRGLLGVHEFEYSLLQRGAEREVIPAAAALGIGGLAWSPLGRGVLTGKYRKNIPADSRAASPHWGGFARALINDDTRPIVEAVHAASNGLGVSPLEVALAWATGTGNIDCAITGARTAAQLRLVLRAIELELPDQIRAALNEVSIPSIDYPDAAAQSL